jgi:hypothetical protein
MERKAKIGISLSLSAIAASLLLWGASWAAISISAIGAWSETVDEADLAGAPGSNLITTYESATDQVSLDISETTAAPPPDTWRVDVKKTDTTWHSDLHLYLKRTSDGTGPGTIMSGGSYQEVTDTYTSFFAGANDRTGINVQLKITGVSVNVPADAYSTTIYYTVVDTF